MKRIIVLAVLFVCFSFAAFSQTQHQTFKGIPMEGTVEQFAKKLEQKGYRRIQTKDRTIILSGDFASYKDCGIVLIGNTEKQITKIIVLFPKADSWSMLESIYGNIKNMMIQKYGDPTSVIEEFQGLYAHYAETDSEKMSAVRSDSFKYISAFLTEQGEIDLQILHLPPGCHVSLCYFDLATQQKTIDKAIEDL